MINKKTNKKYELSDFEFTNKSGCYSVGKIDDKKEFEDCERSFIELGFT